MFFHCILGSACSSCARSTRFNVNEFQCFKKSPRSSTTESSSLSNVHQRGCFVCDPISTSAAQRENMLLASSRNVLASKAAVRPIRLSIDSPTALRPHSQVSPCGNQIVKAMAHIFYFLESTR
eukprot:TRINITY_DN29625_c0_g1_i1.p1 TRINITY_DN29625_c0_g1~~TRINITY_DN29625_c0_g1_i1.p1  ORF type:complete len:123 (+),score=8.70 TRINITY_DN29625_c0_g1_i1:40-408(+)